MSEQRSLMQIRHDPMPDRAHVPAPPQPRRCSCCGHSFAPHLLVVLSVRVADKHYAQRTYCAPCRGRYLAELREYTP